MTCRTLLPLLLAAVALSGCDKKGSEGGGLQLWQQACAGQADTKDAECLEFYKALGAEHPDAADELARCEIKHRANADSSAMDVVNCLSPRTQKAFDEVMAAESKAESATP